MNRRLKWILVFGVVAPIALLAVSQWLIYRNRIVPNEELYAESARKYAAYTAYLQAAPRRLTELDPKYQIAVDSVTASLARHGMNPSEFRAVVQELAEERKYVFHLHHVSAFAARREAAQSGVHVLGNPGGKSCVIVFDRRTGKASRPMLWQ